MSDGQPTEAGELKAKLVLQLGAGQFRTAVHAHQEMIADNFSLDDILSGLASVELL